MLTVRHLKKADAKAVALLIPQLTTNILQPGNMEQRIRDMTEEIGVQWFVAELDGAVIGFGGLAWYSIPSKGTIAWIEEVVVDQQSQGKGVGKAILETLLKLAKQVGAQQIKLTSAPAAQAFYQKQGFLKKDQDYFIKNLF
jgi:N-acetylglutamate synthase-like GNAT family acetyltransferase